MMVLIFPRMIFCFPLKNTEGLLQDILPTNNARGYRSHIQNQRIHPAHLLRKGELGVHLLQLTFRLSG
jgi:hypothetical protein